MRNMCEIENNLLFRSLNSEHMTSVSSLSARFYFMLFFPTFTEEIVHKKSKNMLHLKIYVIIQYLIISNKH